MQGIGRWKAIAGDEVRAAVSNRGEPAQFAGEVKQGQRIVACPEDP